MCQEVQSLSILNYDKLLFGKWIMKKIALAGLVVFLFVYASVFDMRICGLSVNVLNFIVVGFVT